VLDKGAGFVASNPLAVIDSPIFGGDGANNFDVIEPDVVLVS